MLAQLAGEEVDRLLAEADVAQKPEQEPPGEVAEQEAAALNSMLEESERQELQNVVKSELPPTETDAPAKSEGATNTDDLLKSADGSFVAPAAIPPEEDLSSQLDQLFATLTNPKQEKEPELPAPPPPPAVPETPAQEAPVEAEPVATMEKAALVEEEQEQELELPSEMYQTPEVWWAKPLAWLNKPFAFLSESTREKLGWIGIETIIFALLILAYVWWMKGKK